MEWSNREDRHEIWADIRPWFFAKKRLAALSKNGLVLQLTLQSDPRMLCVVRAALGEMAAMSGFPPEQVRLIVLSVDEAMTNVIRHAYGGKTDRPIRVSLYRSRIRSVKGMREALEIRLVDRGVPLDPGKLQGRELEDIRPGGLGLHFIRETMDSVSFRHTKGRNYLRLIKLLPTITPTDAAGEITCR